MNEPQFIVINTEQYLTLDVEQKKIYKIPVYIDINGYYELNIENLTSEEIIKKYSQVNMIFLDI